MKQQNRKLHRTISCCQKMYQSLWSTWQARGAAVIHTGEWNTGVPFHRDFGFVFIVSAATTILATRSSALFTGDSYTKAFICPTKSLGSLSVTTSFLLLKWNAALESIVIIVLYDGYNHPSNFDKRLSEHSVFICNLELMTAFSRLYVFIHSDIDLHEH